MKTYLVYNRMREQIHKLYVLEGSITMDLLPSEVDFLQEVYPELKFWHVYNHYYLISKKK
jgi:hypothetical protein